MCPGSAFCPWVRTLVPKPGGNCPLLECPGGWGHFFPDVSPDTGLCHSRSAAVLLPVKGWQLCGAAGTGPCGGQQESMTNSRCSCSGEPPTAALAKANGHLGQGVCTHMPVHVHMCTHVLMYAVSSLQICSPPSILQLFSFSPLLPASWTPFPFVTQVRH